MLGDDAEGCGAKVFECLGPDFGKIRGHIAGLRGGDAEGVEGAEICLRK
jgi:hypothetical protein